MILSIKSKSSQLQRVIINTLDKNTRAKNTSNKNTNDKNTRDKNTRVQLLKDILKHCVFRKYKVKTPRANVLFIDVVHVLELTYKSSDFEHGNLHQLRWTNRQSCFTFQPRTRKTRFVTPNAHRNRTECLQKNMKLMKKEGRN